MPTWSTTQRCCSLAWLAPILTHPCSTCGNRRNQVRRSFFRPFSSYRYKDVAATAGWVQGRDSCGYDGRDVSPSDTVYLFSVDGTSLASIPIPPSHFRKAYPLSNAAEADLQDAESGCRHSICSRPYRGGPLRVSSCPIKVS